MPELQHGKQDGAGEGHKVKHNKEGGFGVHRALLQGVPPMDEATQVQRGAHCLRSQVEEVGVRGPRHNPPQTHGQRGPHDQASLKSEVERDAGASCWLSEEVRGERVERPHACRTGCRRGAAAFGRLFRVCLRCSGRRRVVEPRLGALLQRLPHAELRARAEIHALAHPLHVHRRATDQLQVPEPQVGHNDRQDDNGGRDPSSIRLALAVDKKVAVVTL
mmetsp:Transcript_85708/g.190696  ORF Transcript_85708/g.190696 Transcript_85708/m.190696 type:complete len:219 (-) Transcript_85708:538-1194(-)